MSEVQVSTVDLSKVIREGLESPYISGLRDYFPDLKSLVRIKQEWPLSEGNNARYHLERFMDSKGYSLTLFGYFNDGSLLPARFSDIEYAPNKFKNCVEEGCFFISNGKESFMLESYIARYDRSYEISLMCDKKYAEKAKDLLRTFRDFIKNNNFYKGQKLRANLSFIKQETPYSWDDLILDDKTKGLLQRNLLSVLTKRELYNRLGTTQKRGIILSGAPGTGKTSIGKILCSTMADWSFLWVSPGDLQRTDTLKAYCEFAKAIAPTILFLEDLDMHFQSRDTNAENSMLGELMNQLDGIEDVSNIVVIGTTNRPGQLEDALAKRPGRFDKVINLGTLPKEVLKKIFERYSQGKLAKDVDMEAVVAQAEGFTGAQVKEAINQAVLKFIDTREVDTVDKLQLTTQDLLEGIALCKGKDFSNTAPSVGFTAPRNTSPFDLDD